MSDMQAAMFNPSKMMYMPSGCMDWSAYLGNYGGGINLNSYLGYGGGYTGNYGGYGGYSGGYGRYGGKFCGAAYPSGSSPALNQFYTPGKNYVENLSINNATLDLQNRIRTNQSSKIASSWERYKNAIKNTREYKILAASGDFSEGQILSHVMDKYAQTSGIDIRAELLNNTHGNFISGVFNGATFGIARDKSSDEWNQHMFGVEPPRGAQLKRHLGVGVGAAATTAALATGTKYFGKGIAGGLLKSMSKSKIAGLALTAAVVGAGISAFSDVT